MNNNQVNNLIQFCFNFHIDMNNDWVTISPGYIMEKWICYIGKNAKDKDVDINKSMNKWIKNWKVNQQTLSEMKSIVNFLSILNSRSLYNWSLPELLDLFNESTDLDIKDINDSYYNGLHTILKSEMYKWLNLEVNKRHYKLIQIL